RQNHRRLGVALFFSFVSWHPRIGPQELTKPQSLPCFAAVLVVGIVLEAAIHDVIATVFGGDYGYACYRVCNVIVRTRAVVNAVLAGPRRAALQPDQLI